MEYQQRIGVNYAGNIGPVRVPSATVARFSGLFLGFLLFVHINIARLSRKPNLFARLH